MCRSKKEAINEISVTGVRHIGGATVTAINDTVAQTGQEEGGAAMSSACKLLSKSVLGRESGGVPAVCRDNTEREANVAPNSSSCP